MRKSRRSHFAPSKDKDGVCDDVDLLVSTLTPACKLSNSVEYRRANSLAEVFISLLFRRSYSLDDLMAERPIEFGALGSAIARPSLESRINQSTTLQNRFREMLAEKQAVRANFIAAADAGNLFRRCSTNSRSLR
jgi:hypothetical protein